MTNFYYKQICYYLLIRFLNKWKLYICITIINLLYIAINKTKTTKTDKLYI